MRLCAFLLFIPVALSGCPAANTGTGMDSAMPPADTSAPDTARPPDSGRPDTATPPRDTGAPDAGPSCACPSFSTTCTPAPAEVPAFSPDTDAILQQLYSVIACADTSLHMAIYEAEWACITDAILARLAEDTDLVVRIVTDDDRCPRSGAGSLMCQLSALETHPRVTIHDDMRSSLMHHKFVIADGARVWVTSANMTTRSHCTDHNNALIVDDAGIVAGYEAEFQRMFTSGQFGPLPESGPLVSGEYSLYFSPQSPVTATSRWFDDVIAAIAAVPSGGTIDVLMSAWTRTEVSDAIVAAAARGVVVRVAVSDIYDQDAPAQAILAAGIPIRTGTIHDKVIVIDGATVVTGSANWSANAWENNENSLWIRDAAVVAAYVAEYERFFPTLDPVTPRP